MRLAARVDENQALIVAALRKVGASVLDIHRLGDDAPDLIVGFRGHNFLLEVKREKGGRISAGQIEFRETWRGQVAVVRTPWEALKVIGAL
jgi:hypothetical protein